VEVDASFLFEYWSDAENFAYLVDAPWFVEYLTAVDALVSIHQQQGDRPSVLRGNVNPVAEMLRHIHG